MIEVKNYAALEELFRVVHVVKYSIEEYVSDAYGDFDANAISSKIRSYLYQKGLEGPHGLSISTLSHTSFYDEEDIEYTFTYRAVIGYRDFEISVSTEYKTIDKSISSKVYINNTAALISVMELD